MWLGGGMDLQRPFPPLTGGARSCRSHSNPHEKFYVEFYEATMRASCADRKSAWESSLPSVLI